MKSTAKSRILDALRTGPQTTAHLAAPDVGGVRFGARLQELRADGWHISERYVRPGRHRYTLLAAKPEPLKFPGPFKACLACAHAWDQAGVARAGCPSCGAGLQWIAEHVTEAARDAEVRRVDVLEVRRALAVSRRRAEADRARAAA